MTDDIKPEEKKDEQPVDYQKDIAGKSVEEVVQDVNKAVAEAPNDVEKKAEVIKPEEKKEEPKEEIEFDPEQFKKEVTEAVKNSLGDVLHGKSEEQKEQVVDKWEQFAKDTWEKDNRNPTYKEALAFVKDQVKEELVADREQKSKEEEKQKEEAIKSQELTKKMINDIVDEELNELYTQNKLPKVKDANDVNDAGIVARKALFQAMLDVNQKRQAEGKPLIYSPHRIFNGYYKAPQQQPAGVDAPIAGGKGAVAEDLGSYSNADLKKPWNTFLNELFSR